MVVTAAATRLDAVLERLVARRGVHHAIVAVERGDGSLRWTGAAGEAHPDGTPMRADTPFHYASITKLYTATAVLQKWERGTLDLNAPLGAYLPATLVSGLHRLDGADHSDTITVRHLLSHTSGLPDYFLDTPKGGESIGHRITRGDIAYTHADVVEMVRGLAPHFPPQDPAADRQRARYSDTNFQLLGAVLEAVTGRAFHEVVTTQILEPAGLDDTWFAGYPRRPEPARPAALWAGDVLLDIPEALRSMASQGGLVGTAADAIAFLRLLLAGDLFERPETLHHMQARWNRFGLPRDRTAMMAPGWPIEYGLGILRYRVPRLLSLGRRTPLLVGHTGSSGSWLFHAPEHDLYLAGTVDQTTAAAVPYRLAPRLVRAAAR
jgi:D-alanyl-D-alanine carboxypeptidase